VRRVGAAAEVRGRGGGSAVREKREVRESDGERDRKDKLGLGYYNIFSGCLRSSTIFFLILKYILLSILG
jgi:hypothetical protein